MLKKRKQKTPEEIELELKINKAENRILEIIGKTNKGVTKSELKKRSKHFREIGAIKQDNIINDLIFNDTLELVANKYYITQDCIDRTNESKNFDYSCFNSFFNSSLMHEPPLFF